MLRYKPKSNFASIQWNETIKQLDRIKFIFFDNKTNSTTNAENIPIFGQSINVHQLVHRETNRFASGRSCVRSYVNKTSIFVNGTGLFRPIISDVVPWDKAVPCSTARTRNACIRGARTRHACSWKRIAADARASYRGSKPWRPGNVTCHSKRKLPAPRFQELDLLRGLSGIMPENDACNLSIHPHYAYFREPLEIGAADVPGIGSTTEIERNQRHVNFSFLSVWLGLNGVRSLHKIHLRGIFNEILIMEEKIMGVNRKDVIFWFWRN